MPTTLLITEFDRPVPPSPGRWLEGEICTVQESTHVWGSSELDLNKFLRYTVTDQTTAQMEYVLQTWNRNLTVINTSVVQPSGLRDISISNTLVNASDDLGQWTPAVTADILALWNDGNPSLTLTNDGIISPSVWNATVILPTEPDEIAFDEFIEQYGLTSQVKRTIWYITSAGMTNIRNAGGSLSGTNAELSSILRDGLLD